MRVFPRFRRRARLARGACIAAPATLAFAVGLPTPTTGQAPGGGDPDRDLRVVVTQIAGATIYVDAGSQAGIETGDTVSVRREPGGDAIGRLVVISAASRSSALTFAGAVFAITRGQPLFLRLSGGAGPTGPAVAPEPGAPARRTPAARGPTVRGRVAIDVDAIDSRTEYGPGPDQAVERRYATPVLRFNALVSDLPGGIRVDVSGRGSYRYASPDAAAQPMSIRLYSASIDKRFSTLPLHLRAGRFYNPYESYSGYWDGGLVRIGGRRAGIGALAGFQPYRWDQKFTTELPKLSVFADFSAGGGRTSYDIDLSGHRVDPRNGLERHTFAGLSQILRHDGLRLSQDLQVDENPETGEWEVTRFHVNASVRASARVDVRAGLSRRRTYRLWESVDVIDYARDRAKLGLAVRSGRSAFVGDVGLVRVDDGDVGPAVSGSIHLPFPGPLGLTAAGSFWKGDRHEALALQPGLSATWSRVRVNAGYRYYRYDYEVSGTLTHAVQTGVSIGLDDGFALLLNGTGQWGEGLRAVRLYSSISKSF
ncbi:MAG: hypothetical protein R3195_12970 [Gemmatimonadota bacterium]|nr:hypothetical protein [Gemmatimonadota bacterium]